MEAGRYGRSVVRRKQERYDRGMRSRPVVATLSENLRGLRRQKGLTQERAAEATGLAYRHYQAIENQERAGVQLATVERLARGLGVEAWELVQPERYPNT